MGFVWVIFQDLSFLFRLETAPPEHRLWELPGQWSLPTHSLRHRRQAEGEDGGGVSSHEKPCIWAPSKFSGLHHVSTSCSWTAFETLVFFQTWGLSDQLSTLRPVAAMFSAVSWMEPFWLYVEVSNQQHCITMLLKAPAPRVCMLHWHKYLAAFHCRIGSVSTGETLLLVPCVKRSWIFLKCEPAAKHMPARHVHDSSCLLVLTHWGQSSFVRAAVILPSHPRGCTGSGTNWFSELRWPKIEQLFTFGVNLWLICFSQPAQWDPTNTSTRGREGLECAAGKDRAAAALACLCQCMKRGRVCAIPQQVQLMWKAWNSTVFLQVSSPSGFAQPFASLRAALF